LRLLFYISQRLAKAQLTNLKSASKGAVNFIDYRLSFIKWMRRNECSAPLELALGLSHWNRPGTKMSVAPLLKVEKEASALCGYPKG
jgi:hypothetical protein